MVPGGRENYRLAAADASELFTPAARVSLKRIGDRTSQTPSENSHIKGYAVERERRGTQPPSPTLSSARRGYFVLSRFVFLPGFDCGEKLSPRVEEGEESGVCRRLYGLGGGQLVPVYGLGEGHRSQTGD